MWIVGSSGVGVRNTSRNLLELSSFLSPLKSFCRKSFRHRCNLIRILNARGPLARLLKQDSLNDILDCITIQVLFFSSPARAVYDSEGSHVQTRSTTQAKEDEIEIAASLSTPRPPWLLHRKPTSPSSPLSCCISTNRFMLYLAMNPTSPLLHAFRWISYQCARLLS